MKHYMNLISPSSKVAAKFLTAVAILVFQTSLSAQINSLELSGETFSKSAGKMTVKVKLIQSSQLPILVTPTTEASIDYDNGQLVSMHCVTSAVFPAVAKLEIEATLSEDHQYAFGSGDLDSSIYSGYQMSDPHESCNTSSLNEVNRAVLSGQILHHSLPIQYLGSDAQLELNFGVFYQHLPIAVSGDENKMSFDGFDFSPLRIHGIKVYYQIVKRTPGSVLTLETGWLDLVGKKN